MDRDIDGLIEETGRNRRKIESAVDAARRELASLQERTVELDEFISRAETALGGQDQSAPAPNSPPLKLHDAMKQILQENGNQWMKAGELTEEINSRGLYRKRDGNLVDVSQIHARANNYYATFMKTGGKIRLREESHMLSTLPEDVVVFIDDDSGFFGWLEQHPDGYVVNCDREPRPTYLVLHRPSCPHFKGGESLHWTKDYVKVCSNRKDNLELWASQAVGGEVTLCRHCFVQ